MPISLLENEKYFPEALMSRRFGYRPAVAVLYPKVRLVTSVPSPLEVGDISEEQWSEIYGLARSYSDKIIVTGSEERLFLVCPTLFPSSSLCPILAVDIPARALLRFARGRKESFAVSESLSSVPSGRSVSEEAEELFLELTECFYGLRVMSEVSVTDIADRIALIARFVGCPTELFTELDRGYTMQGVDMPLLTAFLLDMLMLARARAESRCAQITLSSLYGSPMLEVSFEGDGVSPYALDEYYEWKRIADERDMHLYIYGDRQRVGISMHFYRIDPALLGLKSPSHIKQRSPKWMS